MRALVLFAIAGVGTYLMRASLVVALGRVALPRRVERSLRYIAPAVLAAIVAPALLAPEGAFAPLDPRVFAGILAGVAAWRWRSIPITLAVGMGTFGLLSLL